MPSNSLKDRLFEKGFQETLRWAEEQAETPVNYEAPVLQQRLITPGVLDRACAFVLPLFEAAGQEAPPAETHVERTPYRERVGAFGPVRA